MFIKARFRRNVSDEEEFGEISHININNIALVMHVDDDREFILGLFNGVHGVPYVQIHPDDRTMILKLIKDNEIKEYRLDA